MALFFIFTAPSKKTEKRRKCITTTLRPLIEMSVITLRFKMLIPHLSNAPFHMSIHLSLPSYFRRLFSICPSSAPPFYLAFSLPPLLHVQATPFVSSLPLSLISHSHVLSSSWLTLLSFYSFISLSSSISSSLWQYFVP